MQQVVPVWRSPSTTLIVHAANVARATAPMSQPANKMSAVCGAIAVLRPVVPTLLTPRTRPRIRAVLDAHGNLDKAFRQHLEAFQAKNLDRGGTGFSGRCRLPAEPT